MALSFYDQDKELFGDDPFRSFHDGKLGGSMEKLIYLRNGDSANYYTSVTLAPQMLVYQDWGEFGTTGWGIKLMYGQRRPTEAEWDLVRSGDGIQIPDIGTTLAADTYQYHPVWIRITCPGGEAAAIRDNIRLRAGYFVKKVGA